MDNLDIGDQIPVTKGQFRTPSFSKCVREVRFDFGECIHPIFGAGRIHGVFHRFMPRFQRPIATSDELRELELILRSWVVNFFNIGSDPTYFSEVLEAICGWTYYTYPFPQLGNVKMDLALKLFAYLYFLDDVLDHWLSPDFKNLKTIMNTGWHTLMSLFQENDAAFIDIEGFPMLSELFHALKDILKSLRENGYGSKLGVFSGLLSRYFTAFEEHPINEVDGNCTEEEFLAWRKEVVNGRCSIEICWLLECDSLLPLQILRSESFARLLDHSMTLACCPNDLLGIKRELGDANADNFLVFKIERKLTPVKEAVQQVCQLIEDELAAYFFCREKVLNEFAYDAGLAHYIDVLESLVSGHHFIYLHLARYKAIGQVTLEE